jgi:hypothetical protein
MIRQAGATVAQLIGGTAREIAEVGVRDGKHAWGLLCAFPLAHLTLVDHYRPYAEPGFAWPEALQDQYYAETFRRFFRDRHRVTLMTRTSVQAAGLFPEGFFDFVYIDAGHDQAACDLDLWWPKIRPGGFLGGHDYDLVWPEVIRAVDAFVVAHGLTVSAANYDWLVQKSC